MGNRIITMPTSQLQRHSSDSNPPNRTSSSINESSNSKNKPSPDSNSNLNPEKKRNSIQSTSGYIHDDEFLPPERDYVLEFPWRRIGAFVSSDSESVNEQQLDDLALKGSAHKLSTYIYEKYYADLYWNCSLIIGTCFGSWLISYLGFGFFSFVFVSICTFAVYRSEFRRFNINIRDDMQRIQSKEALEKKIESMDWLNNFISKFWVIYMPALSDLVISNTNQILTDVSPPPPIEKLSLDEFTLGTKSPKIDSIRSFTKLGRDLYQMDWNLNFSPNDISDMTQNELKNKISPKIALGIRIGKGFVGASLPVLVENMTFIGDLRIKIKLGDTFPHINLVSVCFLEPPKIDYSLKPVGGNTLGIDIMSVIPGLSSFVNSLINSNLAPLMYYPNTIDIKPTELLQPPSAIGCLFLKIRGAEYISNNKINPYIKYGPENDLSKQYQTDIKSNTVIPIFNESKYVLIDNISSKFKFELFNLSSNGDSISLGESFFEPQDLLQDPIIDLKESKLVKNNRNVGKLVYDLKWYPVLQSEILPDGSKSNPPDSEIGIIDLTILSAIDLDISKSLVGKLSSFVEIYIDNKLISSSRTIKGTNNPDFNFEVEELIFNKSSSMLKILIKDLSSFNESIIAEFESKILDLTLIDNASNDETENKKQKKKNFTKGKGFFNFTSTWKPLGSITEGDEDDISFVPPIGTFKINIDSCKDLPNLETLGTIDPYVEILSGGKIKGVTSVVESSLNPKFDEDFYVSILSKNQKIRLNCMDVENKGKKNRLVGNLIINLSKFFNDESYHNKTIEMNDHLTRNGKNVGFIKYSLTYFPLLPLYSHHELEQIKEKSEKAEAESDDLDELEEQAKFLEDYKKHPDNYEWVDINEEVKNLVNHDSNKDKIILSLDELVKSNNGVLGINLISGNLDVKTAFVQIIIDDHAYPDFISRKSKNGKLGALSGECFIRDLNHSILNFRIVKNQRPIHKSDILYETMDSFKVIDLLKKGFDEPVEIKLDNSKLKLMFEYVPTAESSNSIANIEDTGLLKFDLINVSNLMAADRGGKSDPYVVGYIHNRQIFKSNIIKKTLNPEFNESFKIPVKSRSREKLILKFFDWDMASDDDPLGDIIIDLNKLIPNKTVIDEFALNTQGSAKLGFQFQPGYLKPNGLLLSSDDDFAFDPLNTVGAGLSLATGAVGAAGGLATGAVGVAGGLATGTVESMGGIASGVTGGLGKKFMKFHDGHADEQNGKTESKFSHLSLKPPFMGHRSKNSEHDASSMYTKESASRPSDTSTNNSTRRISSMTMLNNNNGSPSQPRLPSSPGIINNGNYQTGRSSMDAVSVNTNAFSGNSAIGGRLSILEMDSFDQISESVNIKVLMKSENGSEKNVYKSKNLKIKNNSLKWHENVAFKCDSSSSMIFVLQSHHTFGKGEVLSEGKIALSDVLGVRDNVRISMTGKINGSLAVNFNYA